MLTWRQTINNRQDFFKRDESIAPVAFFLSFLIHCSLAIFFVFSISANPIPRKPTISFLGSILRGYDLSGVHGGAASYANKNIHKINLPSYLSAKEKTIDHAYLFDKTSNPQNTIKRPKRILKIIPPESLINISNSKENPSTPIPLTAPPREPLKINPQ